MLPIAYFDLNISFDRNIVNHLLQTTLLEAGWRRFSETPLQKASCSNRSTERYAAAIIILGNMAQEPMDLTAGNNMMLDAKKEEKDFVNPKTSLFVTPKAQL